MSITVRFTYSATRFVSEHLIASNSPIDEQLYPIDSVLEVYRNTACSRSLITKLSFDFVSSDLIELTSLERGALVLDGKLEKKDGDLLFAFAREIFRTMHFFVLDPNRLSSNFETEVSWN